MRMFQVNLVHHSKLLMSLDDISSGAAVDGSWGSGSGNHIYYATKRL